MSVANPVSINENFFEDINTEKKAYWLGFILADGSVTEKRLRLSISLKDADHIRKFSEDIESKYAMSEEHTNLGTSSFGTSIYNKKIIKDLNKLGIVPRKSLIATVPLIADSLIVHMIRGIVDGDGSLCVCNDRGRKRKYISLVGSVGVCSFFSSWLEVNFGYKPNVHKCKNIFGVHVSPKKVIQDVAAALYRDSQVSLDRKQAVADAFMKGEL